MVAWLKSVLSALWADIKIALAHPATARQELIATATSVSGDIAVFNAVLPNVPAQVQAVVSVVQAVAVFVLTLLGASEPKAVVLKRITKP